jgi:predicted MFS family arabinose efflux permease
VAASALKRSGLGRLNPWRGLGGLPRQVWVLFAASVVNKAGTMVLPFFVIYLTAELGYSATRASLYVLLYGAGALVAAPFAGRLADLWSPIRVMRASLFLSGVVLLLFPIVRRPVALGIMTVALAVTAESFRPANLTIFGDLVKPELRKAGFAVNRLAVNLGMSVGPMLGGVLATISFRWLFVVDGATSLAAGAILALSAFPPHHRGHPTPEAQALDALEVVHDGPAHLDRRLLLFLAAFFPVVFVFFQHSSSLALYLVQDLRLSAAVYGVLFTVNTLMIVFLEVPFNLATRHWSHARTLGLGALLCAVGFGALAFARDLPSVIGTAVVWTVGEMLLFPGMADYVTAIAPERRRGEYMGLVQMMMGLAFTVGPWGGLQLLARFGGRTMWLVMLAVGLVAAAALTRVVARPPDPTITRSPD